DAAQCLDEEGHGGAGADADDGVVLDVADGGFGGEALLCVGGHGGASGAQRDSARMRRYWCGVTGCTESRLPRSSNLSPSRSSACSRSVARVTGGSRRRTKRTSTSSQRGCSRVDFGSW